MKLTSSLFVALFVGAATLGAAPVTEATPVFAKPETGATVLATLPAGAEFTPASGANAPTGWTAVVLAGPHEVYASNKDVTKSLDVRVGSPYLLDAKSDAPALTLAEKGDQTEIIDYRGRWTKFRLTKSVTGYIKSPAAQAVTYTPTSRPATTASAPAASTASATVTAGVGRAAAVGDGGSSALPRLFQGTFTSTYNPLRPRRPYDFQLNDDAGSRYAYVDVSKLLATEQLNKFVGRTVVVYGTAQSVGGGKEMVVIAESLQLR